MNTFYDFLNNRNPSYLSEQDFGQMPVQPQQQQGQQQPQQGLPQQKQGQQIKPADIYTVYGDLNKSVEKAIEVVVNFVNAHQRKNEWFEGAKLMNIYDKIGKDIAASQQLLKPLLQNQQ